MNGTLQNEMLKGSVELKLPAQRGMMLVLRLTTAGVIARAGLTVDRMDDVKMAVEEACSCLIETQHAPKELLVRFLTDAAGLTISVCAEGSCEGGAPDEDELGVVRCILESLVDSVEFRLRGGMIGSIELRVALNG